VRVGRVVVVGGLECSACGEESEALAGGVECFGVVWALDVWEGVSGEGTGLKVGVDGLGEWSGKGYVW
jgi:hypothetical protein